jgi:lipoprotein-releasing system ATP-binding protein
VKNAFFLAASALPEMGNSWASWCTGSARESGTKIANLASKDKVRGEGIENARPRREMMQNAQEGYGTEESDRGGGSVVLETRGLRKVYGSGEKCLAVLMDANLILRRGEMVAIVAPSGAGKSTLLHLLAALDTPTSGTVYFATKAIETNDDAALSEFRNRAVGFLWQRHQLLPDFTAAENVAMPLLLRGDNFAAAQGMARKWLAEVGLENRADHRAGELSGGEQQRVAIARALVTGPSVLLADEPTGDLDEQNAWAVFELLERLHRTHRLTSLIATHNLALAARCDRILGLEHGVLQTREVVAAASRVPGGEAS